jgi:hypothetical protein
VPVSIDENSIDENENSIDFISLFGKLSEIGNPIT